jgi:hypothetical protein
VLSIGLGDVTDADIILAIIVASVLLGLSQDRAARCAIDALLARASSRRGDAAR